MEVPAVLASLPPEQHQGRKAQPPLVGAWGTWGAPRGGGCGANLGIRGRLQAQL